MLFSEIPLASPERTLKTPCRWKNQVNWRESSGDKRGKDYPLLLSHNGSQSRYSKGEKTKLNHTQGRIIGIAYSQKVAHWLAGFNRYDPLVYITK